MTDKHAIGAAFNKDTVHTTLGGFVVGTKVIATLFFGDDGKTYLVIPEEGAPYVRFCSSGAYPAEPLDKGRD